MRILNEILSNHTLPASEMKNQLRKILTQERKDKAQKSNPWKWGQRQFFRALELFKIKDLDELNQKFRVACYSPMQGELDLKFLASQDWIYPEQFDLFTPQKNRPLFCFVPALAASKNGYRLGYGRGFYDRFLEKWKGDVVSVLCLPSEDFLFDTLPIEDHDQRVDTIIF